MKVVITFSTFDLFRSGLVKMLEEAKQQCDYLIVGLQLEPSMDYPKKNGPPQSIIERYIQLKGFKHLDELYRMYQSKIQKIFCILLNWMFGLLVMTKRKKTLQVEPIVKKKIDKSITTLEIIDRKQVKSVENK